MKNAAKDYCYEKIAKPHFPFYYSLRSLKSNQRDYVVAVHAFYREMEDLLFEFQNQELFYNKLNWWQSEVLQLMTKSSSHPVLIILQRDGTDLEKTQHRLLKIIDGFLGFSSAPFATFDEVIVYWMRTAGERECLLNDYLNHDKSISTDIIYQLMLVIEIVNYLQYLRLYVRHDIIYFSSDELERFSVPLESLKKYVTNDAIKKLLQFQLEKMENAYGLINKLSKKERLALSHLVIRCKMARAILLEIKKSDFCVLENLIQLTPWRYAWIAFCS